MATIAVAQTIRTPWDTSGFATIATAILSKQYNLSIVLIGDKKAKALNVAHRGKHTPANILTFPVDTQIGEIFLNIPRIRREAHTFSLTPEEHAKYLLIHGCLHLKGYTHGSTMEKAEDRLLKKYVTR